MRFATEIHVSLFFFFASILYQYVSCIQLQDDPVPSESYLRHDAARELLTHGLGSHLETGSSDSFINVEADGIRESDQIVASEFRKEKRFGRPVLEQNRVSSVKSKTRRLKKTRDRGNSQETAADRYDRIVQSGSADERSAVRNSEISAAAALTAADISEQLREARAAAAKHPAKSSSSVGSGAGIGRDLDGSELRQLSSSDLLALKVDTNLRSGLSHWLAKYNISLPSSFLSSIDKLDLCPEHSSDGLPHYCTQMGDGQYYDPWNPWCGYIECSAESATRKVCSLGTWMGFHGADTIMPAGAGTPVADPGLNDDRKQQQQPMLMNKDDMCRKALSQKIVGHVCGAHTDYRLCGMAGQM